MPMADHVDTSNVNALSLVLLYGSFIAGSALNVFWFVKIMQGAIKLVTEGKGKGKGKGKDKKTE